MTKLLGAVIGLVAEANRRFSDVDEFAVFMCVLERELLIRRSGQLQGKGLSVHQIGLSLHIPYETTRRKVLRLVEKGLIARPRGIRVALGVDVEEELRFLNKFGCNNAETA